MADPSPHLALKDLAENLAQNSGDRELLLLSLIRQVSRLETRVAVAEAKLVLAEDWRRDLAERLDDLETCYKD